MPAVAAPTRMSSVLGEERPGLGRHTFLGGNFFMLRMLNNYRGELGVEAGPQELDASAKATVAQLEQDTANISIDRAEAANGRIEVEVAVQNLTGHKLPTGYPSRRVWIHLTVRDRDGQAVFESGEIAASGLIEGNDADADAGRVEPHHAEIRSEDQVQIYEAAMQDASGALTTGLLRATAFAKDNRLLPRGFDKTTADPDIAVIGSAREDPDFTSQGDRVRYVVDPAGRPGPFRIDVELRYQPIAYRWAQNLKPYDAAETRRFVNWYDAMASTSSVVLARSSASVR
jgi:hypothetical protein